MSRWRAKRPRTVLAAVLVFAGAAALLAAMVFDGRAEADLSGKNVPVNAGATDQGNINANNSPTLAQNPRRPRNLVVVNRVDTPEYACGLQVSEDRGSKWSSVEVPIPPGEEPKCFAPDVTFAADGTLYMTYLTLRGNGNTPNAVWLVSSVDGGKTLTEPRKVAGRLRFQVRLTADPKRPKRLYLTWLQASDVGLYRFIAPGNPIEVTRSDDGGASWGKPVPVSDPQRGRVLAPAPAVGPDGALYVLYLDVGDDRLDYEGVHEGSKGPPYDGRFALVLGRSADGGETWQQSLVDDRVVPTRRFIAFLPPFPSLAVDPSNGRIFAAFEDGSRSPSDVHVWSLARGASEWDGPTRVNDTPARDGTSQYLPKIAVAPDGRLDVTYYDRRNDSTNRFNDVSLQSSTDAGDSFTPKVALTDRSFDSGIGAGSERGLPDLGNRLGLVSENGGVFAAWTDTRAGDEGSNKQVITFATGKVASSTAPSEPVRKALRYGGIALLLVGLALLLSVGDSWPFNGASKSSRGA